MSEEKPKAAAPAGKEGEEGAKAPAKKKGLDKKYIIIGAILLADVGIMAGLGFFIVSKLKGDTVDPVAEAAREQEEHEREKKAKLTRIGMVLPKPLAFTVNISGGSGGSHYLKCGIQLEWEGEENAEGGGGHGGGPALSGVGLEIEKRMPKVNDIIINILSSQPYADLLQPAGKQKIKEAIVTEINAILPEPVVEKGHEKEKGHGEAHGSGKLTNAFFTEFLVQ